MSRLSINLGLALGLVVALLFGVLRVQTLIHNYGTSQWNAGYKQAVGEVRVKQQSADITQLQSSLVLAKQQSADNARSVEQYEDGLGSLRSNVERLRNGTFAASCNPRGPSSVPSVSAAAASVHAGTASSDDGLAGVPRAGLIQHADWCDEDRESLIGLQGYVHSLPLDKGVAQPTVGNDVVASPR